MASPANFVGTHRSTQTMVGKYMAHDAAFVALMRECGPTLERAAAAKMEAQVHSSYTASVDKGPTLEAAKVDHIKALGFIGLKTQPEEHKGKTLQVQIAELVGEILTTIKQIDADFGNPGTRSDLEGTVVAGTSMTEAQVLEAMRNKFLYMCRWLDLYKQALTTKAGDVTAIMRNFGFPNYFTDLSSQKYKLTPAGEKPSKPVGEVDAVLKAVALKFTSDTEFRATQLAGRVSQLEMDKLADAQRELAAAKVQLAEHEEKVRRLTEQHERTLQEEYLLKTQVAEEYVIKAAIETDYVPKTTVEADYVPKTTVEADYVPKTEFDAKVLEMQATIDKLTEELQQTKTQLEAKAEYVPKETLDAEIAKVKEQEQTVARLTDQLAALTTAK